MLVLVDWGIDYQVRYVPAGSLGFAVVRQVMFAGPGLLGVYRFGLALVG